MEKRVIELEKQAAFQAYEISELKEALTLHQERLNILEKQMESLRSQVSDEKLVRDIEDEEPPPHY